MLIGICSMIFLSCHLTSVSHSGGNPELWQDIGLKEKPDTENDKNNKNFHHCFTPE